MAHRKSTTLQLAAFFVFPLATSVFAQAPAASPQTSQDSSTTTLKVTSRLTLEDVTVTDGKGKPVHGLTQSDFTIKEDGKPQEVKSFQEFSAEQPEPHSAPLHLPSNVYSTQQTTAATAVNILLIDDVTTGLAYHLRFAPENQTLVKQQAAKYLNNMPPGTQFAILKMANELTVVQGFTSDRNVLLAAVDSLRPEQVAGTYVTAPGSACNAANNQSDIATTALAAVANFASGIKGRKNLIWFTPGIPWLTNYQRFSNITCLMDYTPELQKAYGLLTAARVAVYPVDPQGTNFCEIPAPPAPPPDCDMTILPHDHESELDIANATGGVAYYNRNDLDAAVGEAIATGSDYYSLSYVPPLSKYDGKYHTIDVKVDRPGLHLQYREGYTSLDITEPLAKDKKNAALAAVPPVSEFHAAMGYGKSEAAELPFNVTAQPSQPSGSSGSTAIGSLNPKLKGEPLVRYDFLYELPAGEIALTSDDPAGIQKGSVEFLIAVFSADGELLNSLDQKATYTIKPDQIAQFRQMPVRVPAQLDLPPGKVFVRVGVLDVTSQKMGIKGIPEIVTQLTSAETALSATPAQQSPPKTIAAATTAKILSIAQIELLLTSNQDKADGKVARQLADVELSERVSPARRSRWEKDFPGGKTREQLMRLADSAAFLNPPEEDVIRDPMPDTETQTKIFAMAVDFAKTTFSRLPNFYATRTTTHFDDVIDVERLTTQGNGAMAPYRQVFVSTSDTRPLSVKGTYNMTVTFQQGSEIHEKAGKGSKPEPSQTGLRTKGEFGPILGTVLGDTIRSRAVTWSRWERGEGRPTAVFRYFVPQDQSTYSAQIPDGEKLMELHPGYHGEIAIDTATGSILRISLVTDTAPPHQAVVMAMLVEYAPVTMGDHTYICPVHGVAYSKVPLAALGPVQVAASGPGPVAAAWPPTQNAAEMTRTELNDTVFTQYHRFGSEVKIIGDATSQTDRNSP